MVIRKIVPALLLIVTTFSGCSTPEERAAKRERERAYELRQAELREIGYRETCGGYGYKNNSPQFNQCVATEKRQYAVDQEAERARAERKELAAQLKSQASRDAFRRKLNCINDGGVTVAGQCFFKD